MPDENNNLPTNTNIIVQTNNNEAKLSQLGDSQKPKRKWLFRSVIFLFVLILVIGISYGAYKYSQKNKYKQDIALLKVGMDAGNIPHYPIYYNRDSVDESIVNQMFEGLVGYENQDKITPVLAVNWNNLDNNNWVFNLRQNVKFNSGNLFNA